MLLPGTHSPYASVRCDGAYTFQKMIYRLPLYITVSAISNDPPDYSNRSELERVSHTAQRSRSGVKLREHYACVCVSVCSALRIAPRRLRKCCAHGRTGIARMQKTASWQPSNNLPTDTHTHVHRVLRACACTAKTSFDDGGTQALNDYCLECK